MPSQWDYDFDNLLEGYTNLGLERGDIVYVVSELWRLRRYRDNTDNLAVVSDHYNAIRQVIGETGTICVSTASLNLCNTDIVFDLANTPSSDVGIFSEFIRTLPGTHRSFHPFVSYAANGPLAQKLTEKVSRHAFGPETPEARLIEQGGKFVSIGMKPALAWSTVHHVEQVMAVPFRYTKEFEHPVVRDGQVHRELFYMHVRYLKTGMTKDRGNKLLNSLVNSNNFKINETKVGRGHIWSFSMLDFYTLACKIFAENIYVQCDDLPKKRVYRL